MPSTESTALSLPSVFNAYRITRLIGRGGMGEVFEAVHERTGAPLAIKVLLSDFGGKADLLARFKREAEITSRLRHPNIVKVFDFDLLPDGRPFIAMELLSGSPLDQLIEPGRPMPLSRVASIVDQAALGLEAAHSASVVHRDLKPANLFVESMAGTDRELVRILDFGISKIRDATSNLTQTMAIIGTPQYMSPEQAMGRTREIDGRSDQFSLGTIVFELLTGRKAFGSDDPQGEDPPAAVLFRVVHTEPPPLKSFGIELPADSELALRKAMSKEPSSRFGSVSDFAKAFLRPLRPLLDADRDRPTSDLPIVPSALPTLALPTPAPSGGSGALANATKILPTGDTFAPAPISAIDAGVASKARSRMALVGVIAGTAVTVAAATFFFTRNAAPERTAVQAPRAAAPVEAKPPLPVKTATPGQVPAPEPKPPLPEIAQPPAGETAQPRQEPTPDQPKVVPPKSKRGPNKKKRNEDIF